MSAFVSVMSAHPFVFAYLIGVVVTFPIWRLVTTWVMTLPPADGLEAEAAWLEAFEKRWVVWTDALRAVIWPISVPGFLVAMTWSTWREYRRRYRARQLGETFAHVRRTQWREIHGIYECFHGNDVRMCTICTPKQEAESHDPQENDVDRR